MWIHFLLLLFKKDEKFNWCICGRDTKAFIAKHSTQAIEVIVPQDIMDQNIIKDSKKVDKKIVWKDLQRKYLERKHKSRNEANIPNNGEPSAAPGAIVTESDDDEESEEIQNTQQAEEKKLREDLGLELNTEE